MTSRLTSDIYTKMTCVCDPCTCDPCLCSSGKQPAGKTCGCGEACKCAEKLQPKQDSHVASPRIQGPAPNFKGTAVVDGAFRDINLADYRGRWLLLCFVPMAWTFVCPTEIIAFGDAKTKFTERKADVVFCSTDSEHSLLAWAKVSRADGGLGGPSGIVPLLADPSHATSRAYGVLLPDRGIALRGSFLIDPKGILRQITVNDLPVGRSVDEAVRLLDAYQFTDKNGEVCPADWSKGKGGIVADPQGSKKYFKDTFAQK